MSTALVASSFSFVAPLASASQFADVKQTNSHYEAIINLAGRGIINGYEDGTFKPGNFVTRAQAAKIIARTLNLDTSSVEDPQYKDVDKNSEYYPYIAALANAGVINGFDGKFNPSGNVTRGQMSKIIARAFGISSTGELSFKDVPATHEYAKYIGALAENEITLGKEDGKFAMHELVTRGQLASFVTRAEKTTADMSITGTIEKISANSVRVNGKSYKVAQEVAFLLVATNKAALEDANVVATIKENTITAIEEITLYNGHQFDGQGAKIAKLFANQSLTELKNVEASEINHELPISRVTYDNVNVQNLNAYAAAVAVASLNTKVAIEQQTALRFMRSVVGNLMLNAKAVDIEASEDSDIQQVNAPNTSRFMLAGRFGALTVPANTHIAGTGLLDLLKTSAQSFSGITVAPGFLVKQVGANNRIYSWAEAIALLSLNQGNTNLGVVTPPEGNTNPGVVTPPEGNTNPGVVTPPEGNTNPSVDTTTQDKMTIANVLQQLKTVIQGVTLTNDNVLTELEAMLATLNGTEGVTLTLTNFSLTEATAENVGNVEFEVTLTKGKLSEKYVATKEIAALLTLPTENTTQNLADVDTVSATVQTTLDELQASNELTMANVKAAVEALSANGVTVVLANFNMSVATPGKAGNIVIEVAVSKGQINKVVNTTKEIAALDLEIPELPQESVDSTTQDTASVQLVLTTVNKALEDLLATNELTLTSIQELLNSLTSDGVNVTVTKFDLQAATIDNVGTLALAVTVTKGKVTELIEVTKEITALVVIEPEDQVAKDTAAVQAVLANVKEVLDKLVVTNGTTLSTVNDALAAFATEETTISLVNFAVTPATTEATGSINLQVKVTKGAVSELYDLTKEIAKVSLPTVSDEQVVKEVLATIEEALNLGEYKNNLDAIAIQNYYAAVEKNGATVQLTEINVQKATQHSNGSVTFKLTVTKNERSQSKVIVKEIKKLQSKPPHHFATVPVVSENGTILVDGEERAVAPAVVSALQVLQELETTQQGTVQMMMAESEDGQSVALQAVTIEAADNTTVLDFDTIPNDVDVTIIGDNVTQIQNLQSTGSVAIETAGAIAFTGDTSLNQVTLTNATDVTGLVANRLIAQASTAMSFDTTSNINTAEFNGVNAVDGLHADSATFAGNSSVDISNVNVGALSINETPTIASNPYARIATLNAVASTTTIKISVENSTIEDFVINRQDVVVDAQNKNNVISNVTIKANNAELVMSEIGSLSIEQGVSYLRLGTIETQAKISKIVLDLTNDIHLLGNAVIAQLDITLTNAAAKVKKDSTITVTNTNNLAAIEQPATYTLAPGTVLGRYTISGLPVNTYYSLLTHKNAPAPSLPIAQLKKYSTFVFLDSTIQQIALYDSSGNALSSPSILTDPLNRPAIDVVDINASSTSSNVMINVTTPNLTELAARFKHFAVYTHGMTSGGYRVSEILFERGTFSNSFKITPKSNQPHLLEVPAGTVSSVSNVVVVASGYVYDSISSANKDQKLEVLKSLAQYARTHNDQSILYDYLTTTIAVDGKTYDSIFIDSIIDKLLSANAPTTLDQLTQFINDKGTAVTYNKIVPISDLWLGTGVTKVSGDGTNSKISIEGSNLLIDALASGTEIVTFKDASNNYSLLEVVVNTAATDENKITVRLINKEVAANTEILHGDARLVTNADKTYLLPATLGTKTIIYTPNTSSSVLGTLQSAIATSDGVYTLAPVTAKSILLEELNLSSTIAREQKPSSGYITTDSAIHFYAITNGNDQYTITDGTNKTAVYVESDGTTISNVVTAKKAITASQLAIGTVKTITSKTTGTTMHTSYTADGVVIFASKADDSASFEVESQDGKISLVNVKTTASGAIDYVADDLTQAIKLGVVKYEVTGLTGTSMIAPRTATGDLKEDVVRLVDNTIYATGVGKQRIIFTDGQQIEVNITQVAGGYSLEVEEISAVTLTAAELNLQNISQIQTNGTSAAAVNVANGHVSITANANQSGKTEVIVTDADGKKAIVYVEVDAGALKDMDAVATGDQLYRIARTQIVKADLGFTSNVQSVSERKEAARAVVTSDGITIYATGAGFATFTVLDTANKKSLVNVAVTKSATTNELEAKATVVKHDTMDTTATVAGLGQEIATDAVGAGIVRIEGNVLYALKEGTVDLAIKDTSGLFYRVTVVLNETTGEYSFATPELVSKAVFTATELGLTDITSASSSDEAIATVAYASDKITITTQTKDANGRITVTGPDGQAFVYMSKAGNVLTTAIEKATEKIDVSLGGLTNVSSLKDWSNDGIVRSFESGTLLDFFVVQDGKTSYKVTDSTGKTTIINLPVTTNASGHREIEPEVVKEVITGATGATIVSGTSVRLYKEADNSFYAYAVGLGDTLVKLADGTLMNYTVSITGGIYTVVSAEVTNGLTVTDAELGLSGNLTITEIDSAIATAVAMGNTITFHGQVDAGVTSALVTDGSKTIRVRVEILAGSVTPKITVKPIVVELNPAGATESKEATSIHENANDIAWISADGGTIQILKEGTFYYVEENVTASTKTVKKIVITKTGTNYKVTGPTDVKNVIKTAGDLGLVSALEVQTGYNTNVVYAGMVGADFVAYQKGTGSTDVTVKDGQGQFTLIHMTADATTLTATIPVALKSDASDFTFEAADYDLSSVVNVTIANSQIAQRHTNGKLYLLKEGTTYATVDDGAGNKALVTITVTKPADKLVATVKTVVKTAAELAAGATSVTALPGTQTDTSIVRVAGGKVYAVGAGETKVKLDNQIVTVIVKEEANAYTLTIGTAVNFITLPIGEGTFTLADVTQTNAALVTRDDKGTAADKTDDQLIISVNAPNGSLDLTISDSTGKKTVHHIKVENGVITNPPAQALENLTTEVTGIANTTLPVTGSPVEVVQIHEHDTVQKLHLLTEGKVALKGSDGLVNVAVTRDATTKYFKATQTIVKNAIKEELNVTDTNFKVVETEVDGVKKYTLHALNVTNAPTIYYTDNYRLATHTQLINDEYVLTVEERHKTEVDYASYGLTHSNTVPLTVRSEDEDLVKVEVTAAGDLVLYAGAGQTTATGTATITVTETTNPTGNKQITIKATRAEDGTVSYVVQGQVDAIKFADIGITPTDASPVTVEGHNESFVQANVTATGISLSAQTPGTTSFLVKQGDAVKAIYNITVADGKAVPVLVKYDGTLTDNVITGNGTILRKNGASYYAVAEGVALYESNDTTATQLRVVKNTETNLYSITPTVFNMVKGATNLDFAVNADTTLNVSNSSIADAYVANGTLYIVGKSQGSADILVTTGNDKAVVHAHVTAGGVTANVVDSYTSVDTIAGTVTGNNWIQVRNNKLYALAVKTSTITVGGTLVTAEVTRNMDTNEFDVKLARVKHVFAAGATVKLVNDETATEDTVIKINGNEIYAKAVGKTQVFVNGVVRNVEVVANPDGTYKIAVIDAKVQHIIKASDLGLTLTPTTNVAIRSITGSNILETQVIDQNLYIYALGTGTAELVIDDKTVVYVSITSTNNVFTIAPPQIAKAEISNAGTFNSTDVKVRIEGNTIFGLQEGISLVEQTNADGKTLHKVLVARENNVLKVSTSIIETAFTWTPKDGETVFTDPGGIVRLANDKLIAIATGDTTFSDKNGTYRVTVDENTGDMKFEVLDTKEIDFAGLLTAITESPASTLLGVTYSGTKLNVTAKAEGSEIIQVKGSSTTGNNTVLVHVTVTKDASNTYSIAADPIKAEILTTELGFHPTTVESLGANGIVIIDGSKVLVYPGSGTVSGKYYFKINGTNVNGNTPQAIYSLDVATGGVKLENDIVTGYEVEPLHVDIPISQLNIDPTVVVVDGTAKASKKVENGNEVLEVILNNEETSYVIVRGENATYKSIEVKATADGSNNYTSKSKVHGTYVLDKVTQMSPTGNVKSVNDGTKSILYATAVGEFAYEYDGEIYNAEVTKNTEDIYSFSTGTKVEVSLSNPRLVDGDLNIKIDGSGTHGVAKLGTAIYATTDGYKKVIVKTNTTNQVEVVVEAVPSQSLPNTVVSASILKAPASFKLDGNIVYGGTAAEFATGVADKDKAVIISTTDGDGRVTLYKATVTVGADGVVSYDFAPISSNVFTDAEWDPTTTYTVSKIDNEAVARVKDNQVYFMGAGEVSITYKSATGLERTIKYSVDADTFVLTTTQEENVIYYTREQVTDTNIKLTFDLNVTTFPDGMDDFIIAPKEGESITGIARQFKNTLVIRTNEIGTVEGSQTSGNLYIQLPEFSFNDDLKVAVTVKKVGTEYVLTFGTGDFKFIQRTNQ